METKQQLRDRIKALTGELGNTKARHKIVLKDLKRAKLRLTTQGITWSWKAYDFFARDSHPANPGRYLIYRVKCDKMHFEQYNGNGWASSNNEELYWCKPAKPYIAKK